MNNKIKKEYVLEGYLADAGQHFLSNVLEPRQTPLTDTEIDALVDDDMETFDSTKVEQKEQKRQEERITCHEVCRTLEGMAVIEMENEGTFSMGKYSIPHLVYIFTSLCLPDVTKEFYNKWIDVYYGVKNAVDVFYFGVGL